MAEVSVGQAKSPDVWALEALMDEFFAPGSNSARQAEIEMRLRAFLDQNDSWHHALTFLDQSRHPHVLMYALNILQTWIHARWLALSGPEHARIRQNLDRHLVAAAQAPSGSAPPAFVRRKLMRLLVDIARSDWPHFYPDFVPRLHSWLGTPDTRALGLEMWLITSEELATPRADLPTARQHELRKLLELHVDQVSGFDPRCESESFTHLQIRFVVPVGRGHHSARPVGCGARLRWPPYASAFAQWRTKPTRRFFRSFGSDGPVSDGICG